MKNSDKTFAHKIWANHVTLRGAIGCVSSQAAKDILKEMSTYPNHLVGVSIDQRGQVSFARKKEHKYNPDRRVRMSLMRYIKRCLPVASQMADHALQHVCAETSDSLWGIDTSKVVTLTGEDIVEFYNDDDNNLGSCMSYSSCRQWIRNVYASNPEKVSLLTLGDCNNPIARALLWKADCGTLICDRIYPNDSGNHNHATILEKATQLGAVIRNQHGSPGYDDFDKNYTVTLENYCSDDGIPYMDSFSRTDNVNGYNLVLNTRCGNITLHDYENGNMDNACCENCSGSVCEDDAMRHDGYTYCQECYNELFFECEDCYETCNRDEVCVGGDRYLCPSCFDESFTYCNKCGEATSNDETRETRDGDMCVDCFENNYFTCDKCDEVFCNEDHNSHNGDSLCNDCLAEAEAKEKEEEKENELVTA